MARILLPPDGGVDDAVPADVGSDEGPCAWLTPDDISDAGRDDLSHVIIDRMG